MQGVTPGRMVHYVAYGTPGGEYPAGIHRAAVITEVPPAGSVADRLGEVGLCVLNPTGIFFNRAVPFDEEERAPGTWHWIEPA